MNIFGLTVQASLDYLLYLDVGSEYESFGTVRMVDDPTIPEAMP